MPASTQAASFEKAATDFLKGHGLTMLTGTSGLYDLLAYDPATGEDVLVLLYVTGTDDLSFPNVLTWDKRLTRTARGLRKAYLEENPGTEDARVDVIRLTYEPDSLAPRVLRLIRVNKTVSYLKPRKGTVMADEAGYDDDDVLDDQEQDA